jgi:hypothetical protein
MPHLLARVRALIHQSTDIADPQIALIAEYAIPALQSYLHDHVLHDPPLHVSHAQNIASYNGATAFRKHIYALTLRRRGPFSIQARIDRQLTETVPLTRRTRESLVRQVGYRDMSINTVDDSPEVWISSILHPTTISETEAARGLGNQLEQLMLTCDR